MSWTLVDITTFINEFTFFKCIFIINRLNVFNYNVNLENEFQLPSTNIIYLNLKVNSTSNDF